MNYAIRSPRFARALLAALAMVVTGPVLAQTTVWPTRQVNLLVPYPPGGYIDLVTRILADGLRDKAGQTVLVLNRVGGNGQVALGDLTRAAPDGYTLLTNNDGGIGVAAAVDRNFRFDPAKDYSALAQVVEAQYIFVVRAGVPAKTVAEFIDYARKASKPVTFASPGTGSTPHIAAEYFARRVGFPMIHVPYSGAGPAINDLVSGQVDAYLASMPTMLGHIGGDRVRALAVLGAERAREAPNVPTMAEAGVPDFVVSGWLGLFGPPNMPADLRALVSHAIAEVIHSSAIVERLRGVSAAAVTKETAEFAPFYLAEIARWRKFSDETGIKAGD